MARKNTKTGIVQEQMVIPSLTLGGYECIPSFNLGLKPSGKKHILDVLAIARDGRKFLVSLKWQQVGGTAEEKIPYEVICLAHAIRTGEGKFSDAYLVLGGEGWSLKQFYLDGGLNDHLRDSGLVKIRSLESFVALANQGNL